MTIEEIVQGIFFVICGVPILVLLGHMVGPSIVTYLERFIALIVKRGRKKRKK